MGLLDRLRRWAEPKRPEKAELPPAILGRPGGDAAVSPPPPPPPPPPGPRVTAATDTQQQTDLAGRCFTAAGRLTLWANRDALSSDITAAGGRFVGSMSGRVDALIVGRGGGAESSAGMRKALEIRNDGGELELMTEETAYCLVHGFPVVGDLELLRARPAWANGNGWRQWEAPSSCVAGESFYRDAFVLAVGQERPAGWMEPRDFTLVRDPENPKDPNAVRVEISGLPVGHLARELAPAVARAIDESRAPSVTALGIVRGGYVISREDRVTSFSVALWLKRVQGPDGRRLKFRVPRGLDEVPYWPPRPFDGRDGCPECGMRKFMIEPRLGHLECTDCGHKWRD